MRHALLIAMVLAACKGRTTETATAGSGSAPSPAAAPAETPRPMPRAPIDMAQAKVTIGCLLERTRYPLEVLKVLAEEAPAPMVRLAALVAIERARADGDSPAIGVMADAIDVLLAVDDADGLRQVFALADAVNANGSMRFTHVGPARARAGLPVAPRDVAGDDAAIVRETAIAGDRAAAQKLLDQLPAEAKKLTWADDRYAGALAALDRTAELQALTAATEQDYRLKLAGVWLLTAIRMGSKLDAPLAEVAKQLAVASPRAMSFFPGIEVFRVAVRAKRASELAGLYPALKQRYEAAELGTLGTRYALARAMGDQAELKALAADPSMAMRLAVDDAPFAEALASIQSKADWDHLDLFVRLWVRSLSSAADPTEATALAAAVCPKPVPPRAKATPAAAGLAITVSSKPGKAQFECTPASVTVELRAGDKVVGETTLDGECHGACTAKERKEGRAELARIQKAIAAGTASESQTDYNFTECMYVGPEVGRTDHVGERDVALIANRAIGPHDVPKVGWRLALEVCGELHVTEPFGEMYTGSWDAKELTVHESADKQAIVVDGASDRWRGVVFRLELPACPGKPLEHATEIEM